MVEQGAEAILEEARNSDVAFLVVGDPFGYYPTPHYVFGLSLIPRSLKTHPVKKQNC
jgi:diphthamide biosynthesis methyltransferase